jgi:hypothetical protein
LALLAFGKRSKVPYEFSSIPEDPRTRYYLFYRCSQALEFESMTFSHSNTAIGRPSQKIGCLKRWFMLVSLHQPL